MRVYLVVVLVLGLIGVVMLEDIIKRVDEYLTEQDQISRSKPRPRGPRPEERIYPNKDLHIYCEGNWPSYRENRRNEVKFKGIRILKLANRSSCIADIHTAVRLFQGKPYRGFCFNTPKDVTRAQIEEEVFQWFYHHPNTRNYNIVRMVTVTLAGVWPCNSENTLGLDEVIPEVIRVDPSSNHTSSDQIEKQSSEPANPFDKPDDPE